MVIIIVARELAITGLRLLAASKNVVLAAEKFGKHKTISQIVAINALLVLDACEEWPALAAKTFPAVGAGVRGNHAVGDGRADGGVRRDLSVAQPGDLLERRVKQNAERRVARAPNFTGQKFGTRGIRHSADGSQFFGSGSVSPELAD